MAEAVEVETMSNAEEAAKQLEQIAAALRAGEYTLASGGDSITVKFPASFELKLEAEFNPAKSKWSVDIGMEWKDR